MIDKATIQRVMDATDIVDVVKEFVTLRKAGVNYKGLCPFHNEKTPSFTVSPSRQYCKCFSCGKGGNAVHFLMELEHMTYPEAIKWLGRKYGIEVKEKELTDAEKAEQSERESMFALNEWAGQYFQDILHSNVDGVAIGMAYFRSRGFRDDIIRKFSLGYSLEERDAFAKAALAHGFNVNFLLKTGLCYKTDDGKILDRYHGRVIFPVHTVSGRVVAFGGRILNTEKQKHVGKYVNSPESIIYNKSRELYGLFQAKTAIVRYDRCFLVEGYTDVISMHQSGIENVVASSGTSLTEGQIRLLHRFTDNITVLYDGDSAGIKASLRGIDMLLAEGLNIKVLLLPDGDDPDSFARKHRAEEFQTYIDRHQVDFIKFKTDLLLEDAAGDPIKRASLISNIVKSISVIPDNVLRQMYVHECAVSLSVNEELIIGEIYKLHRQAKSSDTQNNTTTSDEDAKKDAALQTALQQDAETDITKEEKLLISMVVRYGEKLLHSRNAEDNHQDDNLSQSADNVVNVARYIEEDLQADEIALQSPVSRLILSEALEQIAENPSWQALPYFINHSNPDISRLAAEIGEDNYILSQMQRQQYVSEEERLEELIPRILHDYKYSLIRRRLHELMLQLRNTQAVHDDETAKALMQEFMELSELERQFARILGDRVVLK